MQRVGNKLKKLIKTEVYQKTTCQFQIKFIGPNYLQKYKTLQLFTSLSKFLQASKLFKTHIHRHKSY